MSPSSPVVSGRALAATLERAGFERRGQRGSHLKLRHRGSGRIVIVPLHSELAPGTLASVRRQAGWAVPELQQHLAWRRERPSLER